MPERSLYALVEHLTQELHLARRRNIYEWSGCFARDLAALRAEIDSYRAEAGLPPSPVEPSYPEEEQVAE